MSIDDLIDVDYQILIILDCMLFTDVPLFRFDFGIR